MLVHDESPRNTWPFPVTEELVPGGDGAMRVVRVRTKVGITTWPIMKLYPVEINCEE